MLTTIAIGYYKDLSIYTETHIYIDRCNKKKRESKISILFMYKYSKYTYDEAEYHFNFRLSRMDHKTVTGFILSTALNQFALDEVTMG